MPNSSAVAVDGRGRYLSTALSPGYDTNSKNVVLLRFLNQSLIMTTVEIDQENIIRQIMIIELRFLSYRERFELLVVDSSSQQTS